MYKVKYSEPQSDAGKPREKNKQLGQVFTPCEIADQIVSEISKLVQSWDGVKVLDPCIGEAALPKALVREFGKVFELTAYELDSELAQKASNWTRKAMSGSSVVNCGDFLLRESEVSSWDVVIANPPYIRQEWIAQKTNYQRLAKEKYDLDIPGSSNLYVYFIVEIVKGLRDGGVFGVIVYDSWMHTRYGRWLVSFLNDNCTQLRSIPVGDTPFDGHLIDATILVGKRTYQNKNLESCFLLGVQDTNVMSEGFVSIESEYWTKRGLRLKQASFFMGGFESVEKNNATPFVKKPTNLTGMSVLKDHGESALLLPLSGKKDSLISKELNKRLSKALENPEKNQSILNWFNKQPDFWDRHPAPPTAEILFNYYIRSRPRHIYNPNNYGYADNYYGVIPKNGLSALAAFALLNSTIVVLSLLKCSRTQGKGLRKLQLFEYREAAIPSAKVFSNSQIAQLHKLGKVLASGFDVDKKTVRKIDQIVCQACGGDKEIDPDALSKKIDSFYVKK